MDLHQKRLIEVDFPIREVSEASVDEKYIRKGNIQSLHTWWARRPLAASRATALAALLPDPGDDEKRQELLRLIKDLAPWKAVNNFDEDDPNPDLIKARELIREAYGGRAPKVLDCFAGGGSIPLEALRLGCETYAMDYNPVAVLILKTVLEFPPKYGRSETDSKPGDGLFRDAVSQKNNPLLEAVKYWGNWVLEEARKELAQFYPKDPDGFIPVGYIWAKTIPCQNPTCGAEIPLMRHTWLAKKDKKKIALRMIPNRTANRVDFKVVGQDGAALDFDPDEGTTSRAHARCPVCGGSVDDKTTRKLFCEGKAGQRMVAVVLHHPKRKGKTYRLATENDIKVYRAAEKSLETKRRILWPEWGIDPVPDEPLPPIGTLGFRIQRYNLNTWGDLFNARQKLALITFAQKVRQVYTKIGESELRAKDEGFAKAVVGYLGMILGRISDSCSGQCWWHSTWEIEATTFARQAMPMTWDYFESNPFGSNGYRWEGFQNACEKAIESLSNINCIKAIIPRVTNGSAIRQIYNENQFDIIITDPPYYDNIPYSYLSDYFYVWLKRSLGEIYQELLSTPLTPKSEEIVAYSTGEAGIDIGKKYFEDMIGKSFREIYRILKPEGMAVIVFAYPRTEAWEAIINALLGAGLYLTASWPIHTEMQVRLRSYESAALASSIYMVCRKRNTEEIGEYNKVKKEIEANIKTKLAQFWNEGIRGADFFMSAIGPAVEAFGKYARVEKLSGEIVSVKELLDYVRQVVSEFALERILRSPELGGVDTPTRFYLLYRWTYNHAIIAYDEARKLAIGANVELTDHWGPGGFVVKQKENIKIPPPQERGRDPQFSKKTRFTTMLDVLHRAAYLWDTNQAGKLKEHLAETYGANPLFWQIAQAIADVLPDGDKEKQMLQGLLYGRRDYTPPSKPRTSEDMFDQ